MTNNATPEWGLRSTSNKRGREKLKKGSTQQILVYVMANNIQRQ